MYLLALKFQTRVLREDVQAEIQMWVVFGLGDVQICDWGFCHCWLGFPNPATSTSCRAEQGGPEPEPNPVLTSPSPVGLDGPWDPLLSGATTQDAKNPPQILLPCSSVTVVWED